MSITNNLSTAQMNTRFVTAKEATDIKFRGIPSVMSTPPTVTITNDTGGSTTMGSNGPSLPGVSYTNTLANDTTKYRPLGVGAALPVVGSGGGIQNYAVGWSVGTTSAEAPTIEFLFDGLTVELLLRQFAGVQFHILVDGQYTTRYPQSLGGTANSWGNLKITFSTAAIRRISIEFNASGTFYGGLWKGPLDTVRATEMPNRRLVIAGDSYTAGAYSSSIGSWGNYAARAMGFRDYVNAGLGGSGWLATTNVNSTAYNIANRLTADVINHSPTDIIFALGHNDTSFSNSAIATQVTSTLTSVRSALPNLRSLTVVGPLFAGDTPGVYTAMSTAMQTASAGLADAYVDTVTSPIYTGTGRVGATAGVGNGDLYIGADGVHPTDAGSQWLGAALAHAITDVLD